MKVRRVELQEHPGVGNLSVSFLADDDTPFEVVVIAGGNGSGKSTLLEAIHACMQGQLGHQIGIIRLELELSEVERQRLIATGAFENRAPDLANRIFLSYNSMVNGNWFESFRISGIDRNGAGYDTGIAMYQMPVQAVFRAMFNEAGVDYKSGAPGSVTALSLDANGDKSSRSENIAQQMSQLLVDVRAADAEEVLTWTQQNRGKAIPDEFVDRRMGRFIAAFAAMWPNKRFKGIRREGGSMYVEFVEFGRTSTINQLSTGEKQIAFRGGYLLKDRDRLTDAIIMIDEPELSLHPEWQSRIVSFYREITQQPDGTHPQIIIATHSPFIVHGAPGAKIIVLEKDAATGTVSVSPEPRYPISVESRAVEAFSLERFIAATQHQTLVMTEGESDAIILATAWRKLRPEHPIRFEIRSALGVNNLTNTLNDSELSSKLGARKLVGLFDFDGDGYNRWNGVWNKTGVVSRDEAAGLTKKHPQLPAWAVLLPVPNFRNADASRSLGPRSLMPIESLFEDVNLPAAMRADIVVAGGGRIPQIRNRDKMDFARLTNTLTAESFAAFEPLMQILEDVLA
ncbi:AAA family ATPase [Ensifer sp. LBL]|uniref:AAA family ATPase n=1 Tax=Ensifer sp. LBL TaxID=2991056 RepID=UPI003D23636F